MTRNKINNPALQRNNGRLFSWWLQPRREAARWRKSEKVHIAEKAMALAEQRVKRTRTAVFIRMRGCPWEIHSRLGDLVWEMAKQTQTRPSAL